MNTENNTSNPLNIKEVRCFWHELKYESNTEQNKTQDQESKKSKTDSVPPIKEDKLVAAATKNQTEQSDTQDQESRTDSIQPIKEDKLVATTTQSGTAHY